MSRIGFAETFLFAVEDFARQVECGTISCVAVGMPRLLSISTLRTCFRQFRPRALLQQVLPPCSQWAALALCCRHTRTFAHMATRFSLCDRWLPQLGWVRLCQQQQRLALLDAMAKAAAALRCGLRNSMLTSGRVNFAGGQWLTFITEKQLPRLANGKRGQYGASMSCLLQEAGRAN